MNEEEKFVNRLVADQVFADGTQMAFSEKARYVVADIDQVVRKNQNYTFQALVSIYVKDQDLLIPAGSLFTFVDYDIQYTILTRRYIKLVDNE